MQTAFDNASIPHGDRFEFWRETVCKAYTHAEARIATGSNDARCSLIITNVGTVRVGKLEAPRHIWRRDREHIARDDSEVYMVGLSTTGRGALEQFGRQVDQAPGDIVIYDSTSPFEYQMDTSIFVLKLSKRLLDAKLPCMRKLAAIRFDGSHPLCRILGGMVREASHLDEAHLAETQSGAHISTSLIDMLVAMCDVMRDANPDIQDAARLEKMMRLTRSKLENPELSPETLASLAGMSMRSLHRAFADLGTTPMRWLIAERLSASRDALASGRVRSVTEATFAYGFRDVAHFSRSFKQAFGISPSTLVRRSS